MKRRAWPWKGTPASMPNKRFERGALEVTMATKKYWRIVGYDTTTQIFEKLVPLGTLSEKQMADALRALAARAGLTFDEILDCHARKNAKGYRTLLEVQIESHPKFSMSCGLNPYFIASVVEK
jgi:hypothetical protein